MYGSCKLCLKEVDLQGSHIVPAFLLRWLKNTSGTGYLRFGQTPNQRAQDGMKEYWLCSECEGLFSAWEKDFAEKVFYPVVNDGARVISYGEWLLKFSVSVTWRVLSFIDQTAGLDHFSAEMQEYAKTALSRWSSFLLGGVPNPAEHEQHILILDKIVNYSGGDMPPNMNRYLLRSVQFDAVSSKAEAFVYVKMPHVIIAGIVHSAPSRKWLGTKIHVRKGIVGDEQPEIPGKVGEYIMQQARRMGDLQATISDKQLKIIDSTVKRDEERVVNSRSLDAMEADVRLFGSDAFDWKEES